MFLHSILLFAVATLAAAYSSGYNNYEGYGSGEYKSQCKKLAHYDIDSVNAGHLVRKAKFTHLERNGKHYVMISCPGDAHQYALVAKDSESTFNIHGFGYPSTAVLGAGYKTGVVAKCSGKQTTVKTTDGKKIKIKKVACIQYTNNNSSATSSSVTEASSTISTTPACSSCDTKNFAPPSFNFDTSINYEDIVTPGECKKAIVTCSKDPFQPCPGVIMTIYGPGNEIQVLSDLPANSISREITCQVDGTYAIEGIITGITKFNCDLNCSGLN